MELGRDMKEKLQEECVRVPKTPAKTISARPESKDFLAVGAGRPVIQANQYHGLNQCEDSCNLLSAVNEDGKAQSDEKAEPSIKTSSAYISTPSKKENAKTRKKGDRKRTFRPKVVVEGRIKRTPKIQIPMPSTPKPCTPKPPNHGISKKRLSKKSKCAPKNTLEASTSADVHVDDSQTPVSSHGFFPDSYTEASSSTISMENRHRKYIEENSHEALITHTEECSDRQLVVLAAENTSKLCRRALSFNFLSENDRRELKKDANDPRATSQRGRYSSSLKVYQRVFKVNQCLQNSRKSGPNFPKMCKKKRTRRLRTTKLSGFIAATYGMAIQNGNMNKPLKSIIAAEDIRWRMFKKRQLRKRKVNMTQFSVRCSEGEQSCRRSSSSYGITEILLAPQSSSNCLIPEAPITAVKDPNIKPMALVPHSSTLKLKRINESTPRLYIATLIPRLTPPPKKFTGGLRDVIKRLRSLHIGDVSNRLILKNQNAYGAERKHGELVIYDFKKREPAPKVDIDQETEREWKLVMANGSAGSEEERDENRDKWWKEQREVFRGRVDSFIARMHLIQGDRHFSLWKGSVVDSVVGVFLTQNVSDHLSSSAFMSLAAKFPLQTTTNCTTAMTEDMGVVSEDLECTESCSTEVIPTVPEVNPEMGQCSCNDHHADGEGIIRAESPSRTKKNEPDEKQVNAIDWDDLRKASTTFPERETTNDNLDSVNWEEVRKATIDEVAKAIKIRGQQRILAERIKDSLDRLLRDHKSLNLEWLRDVPPQKAKDYLLSFNGLGLKSVECVRLLSLHHHAFPVDTNVGRVVVRLGWVPLQTLPNSTQIHDLEQYPLLDKVQVYLWPRLCTLDQRTLYELHYQMITFGKVFCKKRNPNCAACPMRGECRHFASAFASARLALSGLKEESPTSTMISVSAVEDLSIVDTTGMNFLPEVLLSESGDQDNNLAPIVEYPPSPVPEPTENFVRDIEDWYGQTEDEDDIPTIRLSTEEFKERMREFMHESNISLPEDDISKALVTFTSEAASIPVPKLKDVSRLKTVHHVYVLPDSHPVLEGVEKREPDDPCPYLLAIWPSDDNPGSSELFSKRSDSQESEVCNDDILGQNFRTVLGTLLIPCRTANRGRFPLNGTYFQVNEVFADDESTQRPLSVPRALLWNLRRRVLYCGASTSAILKGLSTREIQNCFWRGFVCVRSFNRKTREPKVLSKKFHVLSTMVRGKRKFTEEEDE